MTQDSQLHVLLKKLVIPDQNLAKLSFCHGNKATQVNKWAEALAHTQMQEVSVQLYAALPEVGRLKTSPEQRLAILETLRLPVHQCLDGLSRLYLNQPLILPQAALKTATIAQAIQKHLLNAYLVVVRDLCHTRKKEAEPLQAWAIQRALAALSLLVLRSYQLYLPINAQIWTEIHSLYQLALELKVEQLDVPESLPNHQRLHSIHTTYLRIILLAAARPNQLRQEEVAATYNVLNILAPLAELDTYQRDSKANLFVLLLDSNRPPFYKSLLSKHQAHEHQNKILELRTDQLATWLQNQQHEQRDAGSASKLSPALSQHLISAWTQLSLRSFERTEINSEIEITIGLSNIHFYIAEQQPFNLFLNQVSALDDDGASAPLFKKHNAKLKKAPQVTAEDPWEDSFEITDTPLLSGSLPSFNLEKKMSLDEKAHYKGNHPTFTVPLTDRSPGGYGVEWRNEIPAQVKAGELVGLREQGRTKWAIGVVRWVHQIKGASQLGIQILAPHAIPLGIAMVHKTGGLSEYLRALQIPELRAINQPQSLITNAISFHEHNKARLYQPPTEGVSGGGDRSIQLTQTIFATGAFSQFGFRDISTSNSNTNKANDDFNSVWES